MLKELLSYDRKRFGDKIKSNNNAAFLQARVINYR